MTTRHDDLPYLRNLARTYAPGSVEHSDVLMRIAVAEHVESAARVDHYLRDELPAKVNAALHGRSEIRLDAHDQDPPLPSDAADDPVGQALQRRDARYAELVKGRLGVHADDAAKPAPEKQTLSITDLIDGDDPDPVARREAMIRRHRGGK